MYWASSIVGEVKGQGQGRAKGQIHLISYNFATIAALHKASRRIGAVIVSTIDANAIGALTNAKEA